MTTVGWVLPESGTVPQLLRDLAKEIESIEAENASAP